MRSYLPDGWYDMNETERNNEWEAMFLDETVGKNHEFRQHLKRFASDIEILENAPKDYLEKLALQIILAYYLRSLESSGYSPLHPSFAIYAAVFCHNWRISPLRINTEKYGTEWLDTLCKKYNAHPDEQMPPSKSYWGDCDNSEIYADREKYGARPRKSIT